jgi:hypothetical protein
MLARVPSLGITLQTPHGKLLAWRPRRLTGAITFLQGFKFFRRYSDREWIIIILPSISYPNFLEGEVGDVPFPSFPYNALPIGRADWIIGQLVDQQDLLRGGSQTMIRNNFARLRQVGKGKNQKIQNL